MNELMNDWGKIEVSSHLSAIDVVAGTSMEPPPSDRKVPETDERSVDGSEAVGVEDNGGEKQVVCERLWFD